MGKYLSSYTGAQIELAIAKARSLDDLTVSGGTLFVDGEEIVTNESFAVVADITERDALASTYLTAFVVDATDDVTVDAGSATYVLVNSSWVKSSETESMDLVVAGLLPFTESFSSADSTGFVWSSYVLTITHGLNSSNVSITIRDNNGEEVSLANDATGVNTIAVYFPVGNVPITDSYQVYIS